MPERDGYIAGVPCWIDTSHPDPDGVLDFYRGLFGWELEDVMPPGAPGKYYMARLHGGDVAAIGSTPESAPPTAMWNTYIWVDSADETASKARDAGGTVVSEPFDVMASGRMAVFTDPEGAAICVWQANEHKGARVVNEAGSLNFNGLHTRNVEGATAFYGSVFGWKTLDLGPGVLMWALPGYGDYLERDNPGMRKMMAEMGAPEGFADVVASIQPIADDDDSEPHWSVTFAVDDADATADKASELGGKVLAPPFDAPWVRTAVLADPQGATFIANQFVAENRDVGR
jgi:predicted enzyme related to lactoylglutathione lyase